MVEVSFQMIQKPMSKDTVDLHRHKHCYKKFDNALVTASGCCIAGSQILNDNKLNKLSMNILLICQNHRNTTSSLKRHISVVVTFP